MASYTLNLWSEPGQGGEVSFDGQNWQQNASQTSSLPTTFTCYARANAGWRFVRWYRPNQWSRTENPTSISVDEGIVNVEAIFEQVTPTTYTITTAASPVAGGTTTGDGTYAAGASCTITATPGYGYVFLRWEKNGVQVSTSPNYVFAVNESATYTAIFSSNLVRITIVARNGWGQVKFEGGTPTTSYWTRAVPAGTTVVMEAIESGTAHFGGWTGPGSGWSGKRFTRVVNADETWTANFYYLCKASTAQIADPTTPLPVGEVRVIDAVWTTPWNNSLEWKIYEGPSFSVEQRESLQGWHFVKWRYSVGAAWLETSDPTLNIQNMSDVEAIALFQRTPTNLPVTTFNRSTPVRLTYDDRAGGTGLLVADY